MYRYLIDDFVIQYSKKLVKRDFAFKTEMSAQKKGKREYLNDAETKDFTAKLNNYFETHVEIPRIINVGERQTIETLINEEASLFAKYLRNGRKDWTPRIPN